MDMIIPIVDENDKIISYKERSEVQEKDIYRVAALCIKNSKNEILLAQRALTKKQHPGKWGPAAAGTVEKGESYTANIIKETFEEIGLKISKPIKGPKIRTRDLNNYFTQWFFLKLDKGLDQFKIDKSEVENIKWLTKLELQKSIKENPSDFLGSMNTHIEMFFK